MIEEHWFDVFSKAALQATTRRGVVRSAAVLVPGLLLGGASGVAADKKKDARKKGGGRKGSKKRGNKYGNGAQERPGHGNDTAPPERLL